MKTYEFIEESWFASNGCSCCSPVLMECYNLIPKNGVSNVYAYSCHSVDDCYRLALELSGIIDFEMDFDYNDVDFEQLCNKHGINVVIHFDEDIEEEF